MNHPEFKAGNQAIYWFIRDHCKWPTMAKVVYEALYKRWGGEDWYATDSKLAEDTGASRATIKRWRNWLRARQLLAWVSTKTGEKNEYRLLPPWNFLGPDLAQSDLGQSDLGQGQNLAQSDHGQNDLGQSELGDLGHSEPQSIKEKSLKETSSSRRGGAGGETKPVEEEDEPTSSSKGNDPDARASRALRPDSWPRELGPLRHALGGLGSYAPPEAEVSWYAPASGGSESAPFIALTHTYAPLAAAAGRPLVWWFDQAAIYLADHPGEYDATAPSFERPLARIAAGEILAPGIPEWLSLELYRTLDLGDDGWDDAQCGPSWWDDYGDHGLELDTSQASYLAVVRWCRVLNVTENTMWPKMDPVRHEVYKAAQDVLFEAQETGATLLDDVMAQRFRLANLTPAVSARLQQHSAAIEDVLIRAYRLTEPNGPWHFSDAVMRLLFRSALVRLVEAGDLVRAITLSAEEPWTALEMIAQRGWEQKYPQLGPALAAAADAVYQAMPEE